MCPQVFHLPIDFYHREVFIVQGNKNRTEKKVTVVTAGY